MCGQQCRGQLPQPREVKMGSHMGEPGPAGQARDVLGGPDSAGEDELGGPDPAGTKDELGGPDPAGTKDELGGPDPA